MPQPRDPSVTDALMMGARVLALVLGLGGVAALVLLRVHPGTERAGVSGPRVAAPVFVPTRAAPGAPPPAAASRGRAASPGFSLRDLGAPPQGWVRAGRGVRPAELCAVLGRTGWRMTGWSPAEIDPDVGECIGERSFGAGPRATNAFAILRGGTDEAEGGSRLRELRMKLNVLDPETGEAAATLFAATLRGVFARLGWDLPAEVETALRGLAPVEASLSGTRLRFWREPGEVPRFNLVVELPAASPPSDRFAPRPLPPLPPARPGPARLGAAEPMP